MNFFHTGIKAVSRRLLRQKNRLALAHSHGALERAEIALGRTCWRRLETLDEPAAHGAVATLRLLEGELAENAAQIAALGERVKAQEAEREAARSEAQTALAKIEEERKPVAQQEKEAQARLAEQSAALREHDRLTAELDAEQLSLLREHAQLQVTAGVRGGDDAADAGRGLEMRRREINAQRAALPEKVARLKAGREAVAAPLTELDAALRGTRERLKEFTKRAAEVRAGLAAKEKNVTAAVAALNREIATIRRQADRIEEAKEEPYHQAGAVLASHDAQPDGAEAEKLYAEVVRQRQAARSLEELESNWRQESEAANRQDLRIFHFVWVSCCIILTLSLLLVFRAPARREYLPENTEAVVSLNVKRLSPADLAKELQEEPDVWQQLSAGLVRKVAAVPEISLENDVVRITRATVPGDEGDYLLVEMESIADVDALVRAMNRAKSPFSVSIVDGLNRYTRWQGSEQGPSLARIGPKTLALGSAGAVEQLIHVRLGVRPDMRVDADFLNEFARLDQDSTLRVLTARPERLRTLTDPILSVELLNRERCDLLGLAVDLEPGKPVSARFLLRGTTAGQAVSIANFLRDTPDLALRLQAAGPNLFVETPVVDQRGQGVEWRFRMTSPAAKEFLQRVSRLGLSGGGGEKPLAMAERGR